MSIEALKDALPDYAKDLKLNLSAVIGNSDLPQQQLWGTVLACAMATRSPHVLRALEPEAKANLKPEAYQAAKGAAAIMGMNNVYYRALHLLKNQEYRTLPARLRMNVIANPGVDKTDFELWCTAVSAINGCGACLDSHEEELKKRGVPNTAIQAAMRIAAVVNAVSRVVAAEAA